MSTNPHINFYVLESDSGQKSLHFACQLLEKGYVKQQQIYVHTQSQEEAARFDALLWTYRDNSFLPHLLYSFADSEVIQKEEIKNTLPILIGFNDKPPMHYQDTLFNLSAEIPTFYKQFKQVIEIVFLDPVVQQLARLRYKHYRNQTCEMTTHKLKANEI
jgi:DNA polymerase-3 subunit chi